MNLLTVECFTEQGNNAVIRMPNRKYPGVLIQGDTLKNLLDMAEALIVLSVSGSRELKDEAEGLADHIRDIYSYYQAAIQSGGV
jgi:hypothetical protein